MLMVHGSEVLANLSPPLESLRQLVQCGELSGLLAGDLRLDGALPGRQRRLDRARMDQLVADYVAGLSVYALASKYRVDRGAVARHLKDRGVSLRPTLRQPEIDRILRLHAEGQTPNKIGKLVGRDPKTIRSLLRRRGLANDLQGHESGP